MWKSLQETKYYNNKNCEGKMSENINSVDGLKYWSGIKNRFIRMWFYACRGVGILNDFRNLFFVIFGAYYSLKLSNPWLLVVIFVPSIIIIMIMGFVSVHHLGKVMDWLNIKFATHYSLYQYELLEQIRDAIKENKKES